MMRYNMAFPHSPKLGLSALPRTGNYRWRTDYNARNGITSFERLTFAKCGIH